MRLLALALVTLPACVPPASRGRGADDEADEVHLRANPNLEAARELDHEGVRSFRDGRWADAIRYFRAAYRMGAPSSELWNVARCYERLDDGESAAAAIDQYLSQRDLTAADRAEAERELQSLRARPSILTVTTTPPGAIVTLDGKATMGPTPLSVEIHAGAHTIAVRRSGYEPQRRPLEARFGRAVIVSLDLEPAAK